MRLESFAIRAFPPFAPQVCELGERRPTANHGDVHIFVGENGTGKTRLLSFLLAALGNSQELDERSAGTKVELAVVASRNDSNSLAWFSGSQVFQIPKHDIRASLSAFSGQGNGENRLQATNHPTLDLFMGQSTGLSFRAVAAVHDEKLSPMAAVPRVERTQYLTLSPKTADNASLTQSLANMKIRAGMYLAGAPDGKPDRTVRMTNRLEHTLARITGRSFIFIVQQEGAEIRLKVNWGNVLMKLEQLPDGLRSIVGWLATCVTRLDSLLPPIEDPLDTPVILLLDEPETNLHPAWQRKILPALQAMLPKAQLFVATHSPFVVSSANSGWVYVLKADAAGVVKIEPPRPCSAGDTYIDALEDVLGVKEWYDTETEELLTRFRAARDTAEIDFALPQKQIMLDLAKQIGNRSSDLQNVMGQELAQFESRERRVAQAKGG